MAIQRTATVRQGQCSCEVHTVLHVHPGSGPSWGKTLVSRLTRVAPHLPDLISILSKLLFVERILQLKRNDVWKALD